MGVIYPRVNFQVATGVTQVAAGAFTLILPHLSSLAPLLALFFLIGCFLGFFEAGNPSPFLTQLTL